MAVKLGPPPPRDNPRFDAWVLDVWNLLKSLELPESVTQALTPTQAQDLTDGGDSTLHYHAADRARANHTGTQSSTTISDFTPAVLALLGGHSDHAGLTSLGWTSSGHTGTATTVAGFNSSGVAEVLTRTGTGTVVVMSASPTISGTATFSGSTDYSGSAARLKGDFSNGTRANRTLIVDRTTNNSTNLGIIPNGSSTTSALTVFGASDPDNSQFLLMASIGATTVINSGITGTGTQRPLEFQIGGSTKWSIDTSGNITATASTVTWSGNPTHSGNHTFSGSVTAAGVTSNGLVIAQSGTYSGVASSGSLITRTGATTGTVVFGDIPGGASITGSGGILSDAYGALRGIPQNSNSAAYTTVLSDAGKHIFHPSADTTARTFTIDSNANVAYAVGTAITFVNQNGAGVVTIAITSDTMRLAGAGTTGSRTLAANGMATALKVATTEWIISGTGLT